LNPKKDRMRTWLMGLALLVAVPPTFVLGLWEYMDSNAPVLHPDAAKISSATLSDPSSKWIEAVTAARAEVRTALASRNLPGVSVAVGVGGDIVWAEGLGWADLDNETPVTPKTRFRIGTASTVLTSAGAGLLLERNQLALDEPIQTYVPEYEKKELPITLGQVMAHTAGIRGDGGDEGPLFSEKCARPVEALAHLGNGTLRSDPGKEYRFSNYGWILVSATIESVTKEPFLKFMRDQVFEPLGMNDTGADTEPEAVATDRATSYFPKFAGDPRYGPDPMRGINLSCYAGAGVFVSTPSDLVRFGMAINGGKLMKPATVQQLQKTQTLPSGEETGYGLGWDLENIMLAGKPVTTIGHDGDILGGMAVSLVTFREPNLVVAVTSNTSYADTFSLATKIADVFASSRE
jgi:serine beta-lactamase-like protein LACTB, mitochondrial